MKLVRDYIEHRKDLKLLDEEDPLKNLTYLNEEEKKKRLEDEEAAKKEAELKKEEEKTALDAEYAGMDELPRIQKIWNKKVDEMHVKAEDRVVVKRLTIEQKKALFGSIRYSYLHHTDLHALATDPVFDLAKEMIIEGLTYKVDQKEENVLGEKLKINI